MILRQHDHQAVLPPGLEVQAGFPRRPGQQAHIGGAGGNRMEDVGGVALLHLQPDAGVRGQEPGQRFRQHSGHRRHVGI